MKIKANFLNGEGFTAEVPANVDPAADAESVVTLDNRPRTISYIDYTRRPRPSQDPTLGHRFDVRSRLLPVSVWQALDGFPTLIAYWELRRGSVSTFIQDDGECGADLDVGIRTVIANASVAMSALGLPTVALRKPLRRGDPRNPFERDMVHFWPRSEGDRWPIVKVTKEPPWVTEGSSLRRIGSSSAYASVTTADGITVNCLGPQKESKRLQRQASDIAESMQKR